MQRIGVALGALVLLGVGCGDDKKVLDGSVRKDGAIIADVGLKADGGTKVDTGSKADSGSKADTGTKADAGTGCPANYAGCATYDDKTASATVTVNFGDALGLVYSPKCIKIKKGTTVSFKGTFSGHPLEGECGPDTLMKAAVNSGTSKDYTFNTTGTYGYFCTFHKGAGMAGSIQVVP